MKDHQFASSPKCEKFSNIIHDIGDFGHDDDLHDSVFEQQHRTPPDLSPLMGNANTMTPIKDSQAPAQCNSSNNRSSEHHTHQHHNRYFHFDMKPSSNSRKSNEFACSIVGSGGSASGNSGSGIVFGSGSKKAERTLTSPNLSPIRQQETVKEKSSTARKQKLVHSSNKEGLVKVVGELGTEADMNISTSSMFAKSIIFMDIGDADLNESAKLRKKEIDQNVSFSEEIVAYEHHNHYKREEFYKRASLGGEHVEDTTVDKDLVNASPIKHLDEPNELSNDTCRNNYSLIQNLAEDIKPLKVRHHNLESTKSESDTNFKIKNNSIDASHNTENEPSSSNTTLNKLLGGANTLSQNEYFYKGMKYMDQNLFNTSKPLLTTMNSMIETTTNTFNQDSQDTGYQTNSANCGNGKSFGKLFEPLIEFMSKINL